MRVILDCIVFMDNIRHKQTAEEAGELYFPDLLAVSRMVDISQVISFMEDYIYDYNKKKKIRVTQLHVDEPGGILVVHTTLKFPLFQQLYERVFGVIAPISKYLDA